MFIHERRLSISAAVCAVVCLTVASSTASAQSAVKLKASGLMTFKPGATSTFDLSGEGSHLGKCTGHGEVTFQPGETEGSLVGTGVADLAAANGDHIVGIVTWTVDPDGAGKIHIAWRDSVQFGDGSVAYSTGRFATNRPPGIQTIVVTSQLLPLLVVIAIIAILIG